MQFRGLLQPYNAGANIRDGGTPVSKSIKECTPLYRSQIDMEGCALLDLKDIIQIYQNDMIRSKNDIGSRESWKATMPPEFHIQVKKILGSAC